MDEIYDVLIIGAGPAGLTAGIYTSRGKLRTLIIEKGALGGGLATRDLIENYPGYPDGILGPELSSNMVNQALNYDTEVQLGEVEQIKIDDNYKVVKTPFGEYTGKALIIAGGANNKKLAVPSEQEFADKGVFYCATCDGPHFANKVVAVAGGGDSGITEGLYLTKLVSKLIIIEMLPQCTATKVLLDRAFSDSKIEIKCSTKIEAITGDEQVKALELLDVQTGEKSTLEVDGVLVQIGLEPNTAYLGGIVPLDDQGYVLVNDKMETKVPGIFAAGDTRHNSMRQISTAVGDGTTAAMSAARYLASL